MKIIRQSQLWQIFAKLDIIDSILLSGNNRIFSENKKFLNHIEKKLSQKRTENFSKVSGNMKPACKRFAELLVEAAYLWGCRIIVLHKKLGNMQHEVSVTIAIHGERKVTARLR